ncbi:DUF2231 domain-containing protein [Labedella endophytica]|uniref:DUF2231 domain-containing protein n=1 Tax=Labedella endophytica TaxID=1523160 RepID=A0A3S0XDD4_9MICO|nr:DUF2231 domain-containing protein [Labedella endophytica]RUR03284.1 DUF2231 domain-containing protein [Labedella endophytica]
MARTADGRAAVTPAADVPVPHDITGRAVPSAVRTDASPAIDGAESPAEYAGRARAKRPRNPLAGPYGHPLHAIAITLPIGAWTASIVFDVIAFFVDDASAFTTGAAVLVAIGLVGAFAAALLGFLDYGQIPAGTRARMVATVHMVANLVAMALFAVSLVIRWFAGFDEISVFAFVVSLIAMAIVGGSGALGGELAYHFGVRVADEDEQARVFGAKRR